jgi:hypothetical protein
MYFRIVLLLSATALGGCGLVPPAISIASFAADAFSYAVSGKSVSDHGLSMVMQEDCAVLNFVKGEAICAPGPHPEIQMAVPRDPEAERTLLASVEDAPDTVAPDEGGGWAAPAVDLPMQYAAAGPVLDQPSVQPATLLLEPIASGPVGVVASFGSDEPQV